jgi:hypothetical protein
VILQVGCLYLETEEPRPFVITGSDMKGEIDHFTIRATGNNAEFEGIAVYFTCTGKYGEIR